MARNSSKLSGALQENILTLLCYDSDSCPLIISSVGSELFESSVYRTIADKAIAYYRKYKKSAGDHLPDLLEDKLNSPKRSEIRLYTDALNDLHALSDGINSKFVIDQLQDFVRQQSLRKSVTLAAEALQKGDPKAAELELLEGLRTRINVFDKGITLTEAIAGDALYAPHENLINTGIKPFDESGICPAPRELYTCLGLANRGKTWWLQSIGKFAALQRKRVLHVTLEMGEDKVARRYIQSFFSWTRRPERFFTARIKRDDRERFTGIDVERMSRRPSLTDKKARKKLAKLQANFDKSLERILIKEFPTNQLSIDGLNAYLEMLYQEEGYCPDLLIVDYADLMQLDINNLRLDTSRIYKELRGIAQSRNIAVVTASQSNRAGEDSRLLTMKHFAEDYSKAGISDNIVSYNQTTEEHKLNLARLFVVKARDERKGQEVLITQAYSSGQFCLDSVRLLSSEDYWQEVDRHSK